MRRKRALVLGGGGARAAYQVGVLRRLMLEQGTDYGMVCGISAGALNAISLAAGPMGDPAGAYRRLRSIWDDIDDTRIFARSRVLGRCCGLAHGKRSIYDATPMHDLISNDFDIEKIRSGGRHVEIGAVCLGTGESRFADESRDDLDRWAMASASYPIFMEPVLIDGSYWIDGGVKTLIPVMQALRWGADDIDIIITSPFSSFDRIDASRIGSFPAILARVVDLMMDRMMAADLMTVGIEVETVALVDRHSDVSVRIFRPTHRLHANMLEFTNADVGRMMHVGYMDACGR